MNRLITILIFTFFLLANTYATHQRAGEITFKHISGLTYEITIITYTYTPSPADRPELDVRWGDGTYSTLQRTEKINYPNNISRNVYAYVPGIGATEARHTYSSPGTYRIALEDPNRNAGIQNIPNSVNVPLYIDTEIVINPFLGNNSSPVLLNPPIDNGCVGKLYIHNPGAFDTDGDSISYRLVTCRGANGDPIAGYTLPQTSNSFTLDPITGDLIWDAPVKQGEYNVAMAIEEWRSGIRISSLTRDMQITIISCDNNPPEINAIDDTCITAGDTLIFDVVATDPDDDLLTLSSTGGPYEVSINPAFIDPDPATGAGMATTTFHWETICEHVQKQPYYAYFRASDNGFPVSLVDIMTIGITVVSPPPDVFEPEPIGSSIRISWRKAECSKATGYKIHRRNGFYGFVPDNCETGVPSYTGYKLIHTNNSANDTVYQDDNNGEGLIPGIDYCYIITTIFNDGAESYASEELCTALKKDVPIITNVSNDSTDLTPGIAFIAWSKPTELDTVQIPPPYQYVVKRADGINGNNYTELATLNGLDDTLYFDNSINLNTGTVPYKYKIDLQSNSYGYVGSSHPATSIFLMVDPSDEKLLLSWDLSVPWTNDEYHIYRKEEGEADYSLLGITADTAYLDSGLVNQREYCYYVKSVGSYNTSGFVNPLINFSQIKCKRPYDNEPPCPPVLTVETVCDQIENILTWTNPNNYCADDVERYHIYYASTESGDFMLIDSTGSATDTTYIHANLATVTGCYAVTAIDSVGNESEFSNIVCVDFNECPVYELPNVFTPNGDQHNDYFTPYPESIASVQSINMSIFNRWGKIVYETTDPMINWDGKNYKNNIECAEGTYFYICDVFELTLDGVQKRSLQGSITLIR